MDPSGFRDLGFFRAFPVKTTPESKLSLPSSRSMEFFLVESLSFLQWKLESRLSLLPAGKSHKPQKMDFPALGNFCGKDRGQPEFGDLRMTPWGHLSQYSWLVIPGDSWKHGKCHCWEWGMVMPNPCGMLCPPGGCCFTPGMMEKLGKSWDH